MKKILLLLFILCSCTAINTEYIKEHGIIKSVETCVEYKENGKMSHNIYYFGVQFPDTFIYMFNNQKLEIGDTIERYIYRTIEEE